MRGKTVPDGFHTVTPYLLVANVPPLLQFLQDAFANQYWLATPQQSK